MKNNILRISILPLIACFMLTVSDLQQRGNEKGNKGNKEQKGEDKVQGQGNKGSQGENKHPEKDKSLEQQGNNGQGNDKDNRGSDKKSDNADRSDNGRGNSDKKDERADNGKMNGKGRKEVIRWVNDGSVIWNLVDFKNRKHPKDHKKVAVCHQTGNEFPVSINISENALQAHLNHGDQVGPCTIVYTDRFPKTYIVARQGVYNVYETTWENMSYGEALVRLALEKLVGLKSNLAQTRTTLTPVEVQRREVLIMDLENNTTVLQNQLVVTRQRLDGVNVYIPL